MPKAWRHRETLPRGRGQTLLFVSMSPCHSRKDKIQGLSPRILASYWLRIVGRSYTPLLNLGHGNWLAPKLAGLVFWEVDSVKDGVQVDPEG